MSARVSAIQKMGSINLSFKSKYSDKLPSSNRQESSPNSGDSRIKTQRVLSNEERIKQILLKNSNERTTPDIILLSEHIQEVNFLKQFIGTKSPEFLEMCKFLEFEEYPSDHVLFKQGDIGEKFFIILEGEVQISINVKSKRGVTEQKQVGKLLKGGCFGDLALLFNSIRNATIRLSTNTSFIVLRKEIFQKYIKYKTPPNAHEILQFYDTHVLNDYSLDLPEKIQILSKTEQTNYISNSLIVKQGQSINYLYFIKKGVVKVSRMIKFRINPVSRQIQPLDLSNPTPEEIAAQEFKEISLEIDEIYDGSMFMDYELFKNLRSTVSIVAYTPCEILQIQREDLVVLPTRMFNEFKDNIKPYPDDYKLRRIYLEGLQWQKFQNTIVERVSTENRLKKKLQDQVNFFSRSKLLQMPHPPRLVCFDDSLLEEYDGAFKENNLFLDGGKITDNYDENSSQKNSGNNNNNINGNREGILGASSKKNKREFHRSLLDVAEEKETDQNIERQTQQSKQQKQKLPDLQLDDDNEILLYQQALSASKNQSNTNSPSSQFNQLIKILEPSKKVAATPHNYMTTKLKGDVLKNKSNLISNNKHSSFFIRKTPNQASRTFHNQIVQINSRGNNTKGNDIAGGSAINNTTALRHTQSHGFGSIEQDQMSQTCYKPQKKILPRITAQIQYIASNEDIICQNTRQEQAWLRAKVKSK